MFYTIVGQDVPDSLNQRLSARPAHLDRLHALQQAGRLLLAGPFPAIDSNDPGAAGFSGSLIVAEFGSFADAQAWANADHTWQPACMPASASNHSEVFPA
jgi:uncharacterized protein YciI